MSEFFKQFFFKSFETAAIEGNCPRGMFIEVFLNGLCVIQLKSLTVRAHGFVIRSEYDCFLRQAVVSPLFRVLPYIYKELVAGARLITVMTPKKLSLDDVFDCVADWVKNRNVDSIYFFSQSLQASFHECFTYPFAQPSLACGTDFLTVHEHVEAELGILACFPYPLDHCLVKLLQRDHRASDDTVVAGEW